jgi:hypothetical protein
MPKNNNHLLVTQKYFENTSNHNYNNSNIINVTTKLSEDPPRVVHCTANQTTPITAAAAVTTTTATKMFTIAPPGSAHLNFSFSPPTNSCRPGWSRPSGPRDSPTTSKIPSNGGRIANRQTGSFPRGVCNSMVRSIPG